MSNLQAIGESGVTPRLVLEKVLEAIDTIEDIFIVAIHKDEGGHTIWGASDQNSIYYAALALQDMAISQMNGEAERT